MKKVRVFDNGGETIDRYTVYIGTDAFAMSENPLSPIGVNMSIDHSIENETSEELVVVPACLIQAIANRIDELEKEKVLDKF